MLGPQGPPPLAPEAKWLGKMPWPDGVKGDAGFFTECLAFCRFVWRLPAANANAKRCCAFKAILGVLPVVVSTLFSLTILHVQQASMRAEQAMSRPQGRLLADELDADEASASGTGGSDRLKALGLFFAMFCVMAFKTRIHYQYSTTVPLAGVRFHMRHALQRHMVRMQAAASELQIDRGTSKTGAARLTPGASAQLLDPLVLEAVNHVWGFVFEVPQVLAGLLATFVSGLLTGDLYYGPIIPLLYVGATLIAWLSVIGAFLWHRSAQQELAHLKIMWNIRCGSLAAGQIAALSGAQLLPPEARVTCEAREQKIQQYGEAALIYWKRELQAWFLNVVFEDTVAFLQALVYGGAFLIMALLAMEPTVDYFEADVFAAGAALLIGGMIQSSTLAVNLSALVYGHAALLQLADIFNEGHRTLQSPPWSPRRNSLREEQSPLPTRAELHAEL